MLAQPLHLSFCLSNLSPPPPSLRLFKDSCSRAVTPLCFCLIYQLRVLLFLVSVSFYFVLLPTLVYFSFLSFHCPLPRASLSLSTPLIALINFTSRERGDAFLLKFQLPNTKPSSSHSLSPCRGSGGQHFRRRED